jgi:hypothetical protein
VRLAEGETLGVDGLGPQNVVCVGFDLDRFLKLNRLEFIEGDPEHAIARLRDGDAVLVAEQFLVARGLGLGKTIGLGGTNGDIRFEIVGVVSSAGLDIATQFFGLRNLYMEQAASCVFMDFAAVTKHFGTRDAFIMQLTLDPERGEELDEAIKSIVLEQLPGASYASGRMIRGTLDTVANTMLGVTASVSSSPASASAMSSRRASAPVATSSACCGRSAARRRCRCVSSSANRSSLPLPARWSAPPSAFTSPGWARSGIAISPASISRSPSPRCRSRSAGRRSPS